MPRSSIRPPAPCAMTNAGESSLADRSSATLTARSPTPTLHESAFIGALLTAAQLAVRGEVPYRLLLATVRLAEQREVVVGFRKLGRVRERRTIGIGRLARALQVLEKDAEVERQRAVGAAARKPFAIGCLRFGELLAVVQQTRSEEHTSELQ